MKKILLNLLPPFLKKILNKIYLKFFFRRKLSPISEKDFVIILKNDFELQEGDVVLIHSALSKLKLDFSKEKLIELIFSVIGEEGTVLLPCWEIDTNAKDFLLKNPDYIFDVAHSKTKLGGLSEYVRHMSGAFRSFNPINSVVGYGKHAKYLLEEHHLDVLPCGKLSPFYRMMNFNSKIIGLGVDFRYLTFAHCVEDCGDFRFSIDTRYDDIFEVKVKLPDNTMKTFATKVAHKKIGFRDVPGYFKQHIQPKIAKIITKNNTTFFIADAKELYKRMGELAEQNITIYTSEAFKN